MCSIISTGVLCAVSQEFYIDASTLAPSGGDHIKAYLIGPGGQAVPIDIKDNGNGTYTASYTPVELGNLFSFCLLFCLYLFIVYSWNKKS